MTRVLPSVDVLGRDVALEAYRVRVPVAGRDVTAFVPECLMTRHSLRPGGRPSHQQAYEWIAAHRHPLARAIAALAEGARPRPPYDLVTLAHEARNAH